MKIKLIYLFIGLLLLTGIFLTKADSIDKDTLTLIERARELDQKQDLWPGYRLSKYPLDVNYGNIEFRYDDGKIIKQKPTLEVLAFTAYPQEDGPVVKVLPKSMLGQAVNIMGDLSHEDIDDQYITTLFHEAFHAFQFEKGYALNIENENAYEEFINILYLLDNDEQYQKLWLEEEKALVDYYKNNNKNTWLKSYQNRLCYLKEILGEDFDFYIQMENERELTEGTAKYIEDKVMAILKGKENEPVYSDLYPKGVIKFYNRGSLKCLILDKGDDWKDDLFTKEKTLTDLLH